MNKLLQENTLSYITAIFVGYFSLLYLIIQFKIESDPVNFFNDFFTIPILIAQIVFLALGFKHLLKGNRGITVFNVMMLSISTYITIYNLF